jgi:LacI family transcriptional regulator, repressor for deo operon, udp, cdd, tsx, nupC, and nupG
VLRSPNKVTLADIAARAGVSLATASRALSDSYGVSPGTRDRVRAVADQLSYVVSPEASGLAGGRTGRVAVVVPHLSRWFFAEMLAGVEEVLREAGLDLLLYNVDTLDHRRYFFERLPARRKVDAIVVLAFPVTEEERLRLDLVGVGIVAAGGQTARYPSVCIDDRAAGRQAVDHLLSLGHRRIAMIAAEAPLTPGWPVVNGRSLAYCEALAAAGIPVDPALEREVDWGGEEGAEAMADLLAAGPPPTAVYAHSDEVALGALRTLRRAGLRVPQDVSLVGIDDHPLAALTDLTTVHQGVREQGAMAGRMVLGLLRPDENADNAVTVPTHLVVRGTTGPPRAV